MQGIAEVPEHLRIVVNAVEMTETPSEAGGVLTMYLHIRKGMDIIEAAIRAAELLVEYVEWCEKQPAFHIPDSVLDGDKRHLN